MYALATTTISILRGSSTDQFGDEVEDNSTIAASGIPASLIENVKRQQGFQSARRVMDPSSGTPREIYYFICRVPFGTDVLLSDRIKDEADSVIYAITRVSNSLLPGQVQADTRLDLITQS